MDDAADPRPGFVPPDAEIRVGVSSCLMGRNVRWDAGHKRDRFVMDRLGRFVRFVPVCPEVEIGLGTPRETLQLVRADDGPRMVGSRSGTDHTEAMRAYARERAAGLASLGLSGYIFKKNSPSCGLFRVRVYNDQGIPARNGRGLFAAAMAERFHRLPMEEEGRLNDWHLRENFIERLFAYERVTRFFRGEWHQGDLVTFHTAEKLLLMAHDPQAYKALGRLVSGAKDRDRDAVAEEYQAAFMAAMATPATVRKHVNVLQHIAGYFKRDLGHEDKAELQALIDDYRNELVPLIVPVTLIQHYVRTLGVAYLANQTYLAPHPKELVLRNHV